MGKCLFLRKGETHTAPIPLPSGYTKLAYIQSSGTQYIDTGFVPNQNSGIKVDVQLTGLGVNSFIAGARYSTSSQNYTILSNTEDNFRFGYNTIVSSAGVSDTERHVITTDKNLFYLDGTLTCTATYTSFTVYGNVYLFAVNAPSVVYGKIKLYSCQIYDNGTLVRDFVPCINASGEIGLYDLVGKQFYANAGTGTFTGSEVA